MEQDAMEQDAMEQDAMEQDAMERPAARRPQLLALVDRFLEERNIKWVLGIGVVLLFGSSLMLVTTHWNDIAPMSKYGMFLGYTAVIWLAGEITGRWQGLRRTSSVLLALTVLLLPLNFVALYYVGSGRLLFLPVQLAIAVPAAAGIFRHFLRGPQPTFVASYLILALAGLLVPSPTVAPWAHVTGLALWLVFTVGTVKVNRHVFWLGESGARPRVFAFFPVLVLTSQFLTLSLVYLAPEITWAWLGFACALVAVPVVLTGDRVARVFQERTGNLVRPLPWTILIPLACGIAFTAAGLCLAATGLAPGTAGPARLALVPTALAATAVLGLVSARFRSAAFVWATLGTLTLAYNFSPVHFADLARAAVDLGARAVDEARLPYAFYGLTYLPLVILGLEGSRRLRESSADFVAGPLYHYAVGLSGLLLALAATHPKALLPVALAMAGVLLVEASLGRDRGVAVLGAAAWISAGAGLVRFSEAAFGWSLPADSTWVSVALAAGLLVLPERWTDRRLAGAPARAVVLRPGAERRMSAVQSVSRLVLPVLAVSTLALLTWPARLAGVLALGALALSRTSRAGGSAWVILNWHLVAFVAWLCVPSATRLWHVNPLLLGESLPVVAVSALSLTVWSLLEQRRPALVSTVAPVQRILLSVPLVVGLAASLLLPRLSVVDAVATATAFALVVVAELSAACRRQTAVRAWTGLSVIAVAITYLAYFDVIPFANGLSTYCIVGAAFGLWALAAWAGRRVSTSVLATPFQTAAMVLPAVAVAWGLARHVLFAPAWVGANSLALFLAAGFYFWRGLEERRKPLLVLAGVVANIASILIWRDLSFTDPQFYLIPLGFTVLALVEVLKRDIPPASLAPARYLGALLVLVSPTFHIVHGSWPHLLSLMLISVSMIFIAIAARVRALMYTGAAFLAADLGAMILRGSVDRPSLLWAAGIVLGLIVLTLGALAENHREALLARMRRFSALLETWK